MKDFPELDSVKTALVHEAVQAQIRIARRRIGDMLEGRPYVHPESLVDLYLHMSLTLEAIDDRRRSGVPDEQLDLLRQYALDCAKLLSAGCAATPGPALG